jgi:hypothetical protein
MIQGGCRTCFAYEPRRVPGFRYKFEGDKAAETRILCFIDGTHAAFAELFEHAIVRNRFAGHPEPFPVSTSIVEFKPGRDYLRS